MNADFDIVKNIKLTKTQTEILAVITKCADDGLTFGWSHVISIYTNYVKQKVIVNLEVYDVEYEYKNKTGAWVHLIRPLIKCWLSDNYSRVSNEKSDKVITNYKNIVNDNVNKIGKNKRIHSTYSV